MNLVIIKRDATEYDISANYNTIGMRRGQYQTEVKSIERSFNSGSVFIGERRQASSSILISVEINQSTDTLFRTSLNDLYKEFLQIEYLKDSDNAIRTKCELVSINESALNDVGSVLRSAIYEIELKQLLPYWEDTTQSSVSETGVDPVINLTNAGVMPVEPYITVTTATECDGFAIWVDDNQEGIEIQDLTFGDASDLYDYVIDCANGTALLGDDLINRNDKIKGGTGFFTIPVGAQTINTLTSSESLTITIAWRNRYLI